MALPARPVPTTRTVLIMRVSLRSRRATRVALTVPGGVHGSTRTRIFAARGARAVIVAVGFRGPRAWTVLSLPLAITEAPGATARGRVVVTIRKGSPSAKVVPGR